MSARRGLSTGPHLHYEVYRGGEAVNPLSVRFASVPVADTGLANAVKARLKALLSVGVKRARSLGHWLPRRRIAAAMSQL